MTARDVAAAVERAEAYAAQIKAKNRAGEGAPSEAERRLEAIACAEAIERE